MSGKTPRRKTPPVGPGGRTTGDHGLAPKAEKKLSSPPTIASDREEGLWASMEKGPGKGEEAGNGTEIEMTETTTKVLSGVRIAEIVATEVGKGTGMTGEIGTEMETTGAIEKIEAIVGEEVTETEVDIAEGTEETREIFKAKEEGSEIVETSEDRTEAEGEGEETISIILTEGMDSMTGREARALREKIVRSYGIRTDRRGTTSRSPAHRQE